jgi:hypothetical protein
VYFVNHVEKKTQWDDPRPLPQGFEIGYEPSTNRPYFISHYTKKTTWIDPRPEPIITESGSGSSGSSGSGGSGSSSSSSGSHSGGNAGKLKRQDSFEKGVTTNVSSIRSIGSSMK